LPHPPQLFGSFVKLTQVLPHRLGSCVLLHVATQVDPLHAVVPPVGAAGHAAHVPGAAPQSSVPAGHAWQALAAHVAPAAHTWLVPLAQPPQLFGSDVVFTHALPQSVGREAWLHEAMQFAPRHAVVPPVGAAGHVAHMLLQAMVPDGQLLQTPPVHPAGHTVPQAPQFFGSVMVLTSHPFAAFMSQFALGGVHTGIWQVELTQLSVPPVMLHATPQPPQFRALVEVFTSQPFVAL
jgi:hypothetical protein